ncbi:CheD [Ruminiclostridium papyrosolvens DSM 2782]|uniref:Probable chemoreceptor glutamine deamidase CheD n=1 Tax=Ruminiclostridium papyrosolvens DSM 2782 TaxID=588581 RepID=F1THM3_9FIRM|nr:chemotaxis protein CheD [Ruminiclostridium papyrosolvens]EGD46005.1 CheD [Ruminiclostridium papyrosolvens DSM 2782]WES32806.1 chemotaxis protein CheD [Ruminiclostridium papyrosolvens DSM 2782]
MDIEIIKVGMADLNSSRHPCMITTLGLGSCVGVALYDSTAKVAGLAHVMLPSSEQAKNNSNIAKFADTAIVKLVDDMIKLGARKDRIVAKLAGGAQMFVFNQSSDLMRIGYRNVVASKEKLKLLNIPIISEDTGGNYGRTIELYSDDGRLMIKTIGFGIKQI